MDELGVNIRIHKGRGRWVAEALADGYYGCGGCGNYQCALKGKEIRCEWCKRNTALTWLRPLRDEERAKLQKS